MYADKVTKSMKKTIDETAYRREKQLAYNEKNGISPKALNKKVDSIFSNGEQAREEVSIAAEPDIAYMTTDELQLNIRKTRKAMEKAAKELDFIEAARLRDFLKKLQVKKGN
jgi:excinuclease ABC subunit B